MIGCVKESLVRIVFKQQKSVATRKIYHNLENVCEDGEVRGMGKSEYNSGKVHKKLVLLISGHIIHACISTYVCMCEYDRTPTLYKTVTSSLLMFSSLSCRCCYNSNVNGVYKFGTYQPNK